MARRCDYTVDKKRVNSFVLKHLFLEGVEQPKISPKKPGNAPSDALLMSRFQIFAADTAKKNPCCRGFNQLINSNQFGAKHSEKLFSSLLSTGLTEQSRVHIILVDKLKSFVFHSQLFAENGKIQLKPTIRDDLFTCYLNCMCKSIPVCLIQQPSVILLLGSCVQ